MTAPRSPSDRPLCIVYGAALGNSGGTGVYTARLLEGFRALGGASVRVALDGSIVSPGEALQASLPGGIRKACAELWGMASAVRKADPRLVHLPAFAGRVPSGIPSTVTVHDLAFLANPSWFPPGRSLYYRLHFPRAARRAELVIVDSDFSASEAVRLLGIEPARVRRVYLSAPPGDAPAGAFRSEYGIRGEYVLCAGTVEPRKNVGALLDAWPEVIREAPGLTLVVAGRWGWGSRILRKRLSGTRGVIWTGPLPIGLLRSAYAGARLLAYPSLYEGFGLPPLEAAAAGVPSVIGPAGSLGEIYAGIAAARCGSSPASIAKAILEAMGSPCDPGRLKDFARGFGIEAMAAGTLEVYREIAG